MDDAVTIGNCKLIFEGKKRYYYEDLSERDYTLENTTPYILKINDYEINENSWGEMIRSFCFYIQNVLGISDKILLNFKSPWTNKPMFSISEKTNFKKIHDGLYVNCNHTALHSCWFIQDLIEYFKIDLNEIELIIHRPSGTEPKEAREYILNKIKNEFKVFLQINFGLDEKQADEKIKYIDDNINSILKSFSRSYDNVFLFDENRLLSTYKSKVLKYIKNDFAYSQEQIDEISNCFNQITEFYKL